jgi:hypothetical protein
MSNTIKTGVDDYGMKPSPKPSGKVCTDAESTVPGLPERTKGKDQIEEVIYDENASLPERTGGK